MSELERRIVEAAMAALAGTEYDDRVPSGAVSLIAREVAAALTQ